MTTEADSLILAALATLWAHICAAWKESVVGRTLHKGWLGFCALVRESVICQFLWRKSMWTRRWEDSIFCRIVDWVLNLIPNILKWVHRKAPTLTETSLFFRLLGFLQKKMYVLLGLFFFVMLIAPHSMWNNIYGLAGAAVLLVIFCLGGIVNERPRVQTKALSVFFALYAMFVAYGFVFSASRSASFRFLCFHLTCMIIVLLMVSAIESYQQLETMLLFLVAGLVIASFYGCYQRLMGIEVIASQQDLTLNVGMPGRVYSFFDNPNNFAEILVMVIPFFLALLANLKGFWTKLIVFIAMVPCLVAIGMTYSRSGWIGLAFAVLVFIGMQNWRFIPLCIVLGLAAIPMLPQTIVNRIFTIGNMQDSSTRYRFSIYEAVGNLLKDYGVTGVGLGSDVVKQAFQTYPTMFDGSYPIHSHNNYLQVWCEMGIGGLIAFAALLLYQIKNGLRAFYEGYGSRKIRYVLSAALGAFGGILVISVAEYTWFYPRNMFLFWLLFGIIAACIRLGHQEKAKAVQ